MRNPSCAWTRAYLLEERDGVDLHPGHVEPLPVRLKGNAREVSAVIVAIDLGFPLRDSAHSPHNAKQTVKRKQGVIDQAGLSTP